MKESVNWMAFAFPYHFSKLAVHKVDPKDLQPFTIPTMGNQPGDITFYHDEPGATTGLEDFRPGTTFEWFFMHDEVQYVFSGKAEITYSLPPLHQKWENATAEAGCIYLMPRGAHVKFKIVSQEPYRHLFVVMPGGYYPKELLKQ